MIDEMEMKCKYHRNGCESIFKIGVLKEHQAACDFFPIACGNQGCDVISARKLMLEHAPICQFKSEICQKGCMKVLKKSEMSDHNCISSLVAEIKMLKGNQEIMKEQVDEQRL